MLSANEIINMKKEYLCPPSQNHFYKNPPAIVRGSMQYLYDQEGKKYLDFFAGVSVMNCGHCNPRIIEPAIEQMRTLQHTSILYLTEQMGRLAGALSKVLPGKLNKSFFCCTGSEANETALLMAKMYTQKNHFIALENGLHGRTYMTMSTTGIPMWRIDENLSDTIHFAPNPLKHGQTAEQAAARSLEGIKKIIEEVGKDKIAGLIIEPIQGNGGIIAPPKKYFTELKSLLEENEILLIVDEVQTGFARTGKMFAIRHYDIVPDLLTVAKALGNGMPISAACTTDEIASHFNRPSASTLGGNPVCAATGIAVLEYIEKEKQCERAEKLGKMLLEGLYRLKQAYPVIVEVRGIGLMVGAEIRNQKGEADQGLVDEILEKMKDKGILIGKNGLERNVLAFQPPLVITEADVRQLLLSLEEVLKEI